MTEPCRFWWGTRTELCERPAIYRDDPEGGDPHVVVEIARIYRPEAVDDLCRLANLALEHGTDWREREATRMGEAG